MPIAPAAKGIIIVSGVIIAAGVALYENEQVREWFEKTRTDLSQTFQDWVDSLTPEGKERLRQRAGAHAMGAHAMSPGTTVTTRSPTTGPSRGEGLGKSKFEQDTERRRLGQEYLERRKRMMEGKLKRRGAGQLEEAGESIQMEEGPSRAAVTGADVQSGGSALRRRRSSAMQPPIQTAQVQQGQVERYPAETNVVAARDMDVEAPQQSEAEDTDVDADSHISISMTSADFFDAEPAQDTTAADQSTPTFRAAPTPDIPDFVVPPLEISPSIAALSTSNIQAHNETYNYPAVQQAQAGNHGVISAATSTRDGGVTTNTDTDADYVSEAGTETASHVSRLSELDDPMHGAREDDVISISSGGDWSEVSSAVSEDR